MRKILVGLGTLAVLLYVSHVIIGGLLWDTYSHFSLASGLVILLSGVLSAIFIANDWAYFGVVQRNNIGSLQLWMLVTSLKLLAVEAEAD